MSGSDSIYPLPEKRIRVVDTQTKNAGETLRIPLDIDALITEATLVFSASQAMGGGAPTSVDPGRFIESLTIETDSGQLMSLSGKSLNELMQVTEAPNPQRVDNVLIVGQSTSEFSIDVHFENSGALMNLLTALDGIRFRQVTCVIKLASGDGGFIGGTSTGTLAVTVDTLTQAYPTLSGAGIDKSDGNVYAGIGEMRHRNVELVEVSSVTGKGPSFRLEVGNKTRFIMLIAEDFTAGTHVAYRDDIITDLSLVINGVQSRILSAKHARFINSAERDFASTGVVFLDFGDDENGFLSLLGTGEAKLEWNQVLPAGVLQSRITMIQDYSQV